MRSNFKLIKLSSARLHQWDSIIFRNSGCCHLLLQGPKRLQYCECVKTEEMMI